MVVKSSGLTKDRSRAAASAFGAARAVFCFLLRSQRPGLPLVAALFHLGQANFQALVLPLGCPALLFPPIAASLEECNQLLQGAKKR
jgi:hypothetical protein